MATNKSSSKSSKKKPVETEDQLLSKLVKIGGRIVVLDTETTGLNPRGDNPDRLLEIGLVEIADRKLTGRRFHTYINPEREVNPEALAVHGLSNSFLKDKPTFKQVYPALLKFVEGAEIVIHNAPFDVGFLDAELDRVAGLEKVKAKPFSSCVRKVTDTLAIAREVWHGKRNTLDALCDRLSVNRSGRTLHGALLDAEILAEVLLQMGKGQNDLGLFGGATVEEIKKEDVQKAKVTSLDELSVIVLKATEEELAEHNAYIAGMEKETKSLSIWTKIERGLNPLEKYALDGKPDVKPPPPPPPVEKNEDDIPPIEESTGRKPLEINF